MKHIYTLTPSQFFFTFIKMAPIRENKLEVAYMKRRYTKPELYQKCRHWSRESFCEAPSTRDDMATLAEKWINFQEAYYQGSNGRNTGNMIVVYSPRSSTALVKRKTSPGAKPRELLRFVDQRGNEYCAKQQANGNVIATKKDKYKGMARTTKLEASADQIGEQMILSAFGVVVQ